MGEQHCINCNAPDAQEHDLLVRGNSHRGVYLCSACYEAIQREMAESA